MTHNEWESWIDQQLKLHLPRAWGTMRPVGKTPTQKAWRWQSHRDIVL